MRSFFRGGFPFSARFFLLVTLVLGCFHGTRGANQNARLAAIFAFVEPGELETGTFRIDRFLFKYSTRGLRTGDWSKHDGNFYANKAPGTILLGVPIYFLLFHAERAWGADPLSKAYTEWNITILSFFLSAIPSAFAALALLSLLQFWGWTKRDAAVIGITYAFATLILPFSGSVWGHPTASAFLVFAISTMARSTRPASFFFAGAWAGLAIITEYTAVVGLFPMAVLLWRSQRGYGSYAAHAMGLAVPAIVLLGYQWYCFGGPFVTAFEGTNPVYMESGQASVWATFSHFSPLITWKLLFSPARGLFVYCPVLLCCALGLAQLRSREDKIRALAWIVPSVSLLMLISSFNGWHGGWSSGPRYLIPALPFLCLLLPRLSLLHGFGKILFLATLAFSLVNMWAVGLVDTLAPSNMLYPLTQKIYPQAFGLSPLTEKNFLLFAGQDTAKRISSFALLAISVGLIWRWAGKGSDTRTPTA